MKRVISAGIVILFVLTSCLNARAEDQPTLVKMRATAYEDTGSKTRSGNYPHYGTAGGQEDMLGKTIVMYQRLPNDEVGEIIGIFEIEDTGSAKGANEGHVIDVWKPNLDECQDFMDRVYEDGCQGKVWVQFIEADG